MRAYIKKVFKETAKFFNKHTLLFALFITILFVGLTVGAGWYNNKVVTRTANPVAKYSLEPTNPLSFMANWDGPNYISIAKHGYLSDSEANFFPLYPILIHLVNKIISSPLYSALTISWVSLIGAIYYYLKILRKLFTFEDNITAIRGLVFFLLFPSAVFLAAAYTGSLLMLLGLAAIYYAFNKKYLPAAIFALFCTVTNTDGIFALILVCLILLEEGVHYSKAILTFIIGLLGLGDYSLYLDLRFHKPLSFLLSQKSHGWLNFHYSELISSADLFNVIFVILLIVAIIYWRKRRLSFSVYSFLFLLIPLVGNQFGGFNRYMLFAFPVQFMAYDYLKNRHLAYSLALAGMGIAWAYFTFQYAGGYIGG